MSLVGTSTTWPRPRCLGRKTLGLGSTDFTLCLEPVVPVVTVLSSVLLVQHVGAAFNFFVEMVSDAWSPCRLAVPSSHARRKAVWH
jgi:hypothetical protein